MTRQNHDLQNSDLRKSLFVDETSHLVPCDFRSWDDAKPLADNNLSHTFHLSHDFLYPL